MSCDYTEKVSMLIDGELSAQEAAEIKKHVSGCMICRRAHADFLGLRNEIKSYPHELDLIARRRALARILDSKRPPIWKRRIALPAPAFALLLLALAALEIGRA